MIIVADQTQVVFISCNLCAFLIYNFKKVFVLIGRYYNRNYIYIYLHYLTIYTITRSKGYYSYGHKK